MKCEKHGVISTFCRYCDLETIEKHESKSKKILVEESALDSLKAMAQRLQDERDELLNCLENLHATVWGECPSLLNEDSGRNSSLDIQIRDIIAKCTAKPDVLE